ncbi:4-coumarate--CoA ligase family protein [Actinocorallia longicatena]|uniref:4-coumarate--CoA ligase family protein n=2 Tax=Actinocorallia longicatena TaxID=111803 RepID=A0ABP6QG39_9ACTN
MVPDVTVTQAVFGERSRGGRTALTDAASGRTITYAELISLVGSAAAGLRRDGLCEGAVIAVHLPDSPELAVALHAVLAAGAVAVPIRPTETAAAMHRQLVETGARALITWPVLLDIALSAVENTPVARVLCFGAEPDVEPFSRLFSGRPVMPRPRLEPATDLAMIAFTRGTSGPAKQVRLTHRNLVAAMTQMAGAYGESDTVLSALPFTDVLGFSSVLNPALQAGAVVATRPGAGRHDLLRAMQERAVSVALLTPQLVEVLAYDREVGRYNLRALRSVISTGGPLRPEAARAAAQRLRCPVRQAYGLAEAGGLTHINMRAAEEGTLDSVGRGLSDAVWQVRTFSGREESYEPGELWLHGPMVAGEEPWARTGDAGFADEHGRLYIMGRMEAGVAEPPKTGPTSVLQQHPVVSDAAVIPVPDPELGLIAVAFVVVHGPAPDLLAYVNAEMPAFQRVHSLRIVEEIPRGPDGRVRRRSLIEGSG